MRRKRRPVVFVIRMQVAEAMQDVALLISPDHHQEALRDNATGQYRDQRAVPASWSAEASENK